MWAVRFKEVSHRQTWPAQWPHQLGTELGRSGLVGYMTVYWDVRVSDHLPTIEIGISDVQVTIEETMTHATLVPAFPQESTSHPLADRLSPSAANRLPVSSCSVKPAVSICNPSTTSGAAGSRASSNPACSVLTPVASTSPLRRSRACMRAGSTERQGERNNPDRNSRAFLSRFLRTWRDAPQRQHYRPVPILECVPPIPVPRTVTRGTRC